jgi:hypothetical protein
MSRAAPASDRGASSLALNLHRRAREASGFLPFVPSTRFAASMLGFFSVQRLKKPLQTRRYHAVVGSQIDEAQASTDGGYGLTVPACLYIRRW